MALFAGHKKIRKNMNIIAHEIKYCCGEYRKNMDIIYFALFWASIHSDREYRIEGIKFCPYCGRELEIKKL